MHHTGGKSQLRPRGKALSFGTADRAFMVLRLFFSASFSFSFSFFSCFSCFSCSSCSFCSSLTLSFNPCFCFAPWQGGERVWRLLKQHRGRRSWPFESNCVQSRDKLWFISAVSFPVPLCSSFGPTPSTAVLWCQERISGKFAFSS